MLEDVRVFGLKTETAIAEFYRKLKGKLQAADSKKMIAEMEADEAQYVTFIAT